MIVRIHSSGKSFRGTAAYLTHDPEAQTDERVAWTHTRNLANDHVPSAVDEMYWTARNAELLKQEAGVRAGGRATENPVKHLSLNWSPEDNPTREHMIETTEEFIRHMKWQEHQAVMVAHNDKPYAHVHVMLNSVHPENGLRLDDNFEYRRAQAWAGEYEREQGRIYCEQRLREPGQRENAPPRNIWVAFQENEKEFGRAEKSLREKEPIVLDEREIQKNQNDDEWKILKEIQRTERTEFFARGKSEFSQLRLSIYREVREEFRDRWADFYAARRDGADPDTLAALKAELIGDQKVTLEARRDEACKELRETRDGLYRQLLGDQRDIRLDLRTRQEAGLDNAPFLQQLEERNAGKDVTADFRGAADHIVVPHLTGGREASDAASTERHETGGSGGTSGADIETIVGRSLGASFGSFLDSLFCDLVGSEQKPYRPEPVEAKLLQAAADDTFKRELREREEADNERKKRARSPCGE
jgi:hypothetical protein